MSDSDEMDWSSWESLTADQANRLSAQLKREVGQEHRLFDFIGRLKVLAADGGSDDILAADPLDSISAFVVHLTWSDTLEIDG